jgi:hypothetical protein
VPDQPAGAGKCVSGDFFSFSVWGGLVQYCRWYSPLAKITGYLYRYPQLVAFGIMFIIILELLLLFPVGEWRID